MISNITKEQCVSMICSKLHVKCIHLIKLISELPLTKGNVKTRHEMISSSAVGMGARAIALASEYTPSLFQGTFSLVNIFVMFYAIKPISRIIS